MKELQSMNLLWECMLCSSWLCGFEKRIRIRSKKKNLYFSCYFCTFFFWQRERVQSIQCVSVGRRTIVCAQLVCSCDMEWCGLVWKFSLFGMSIKLMLRYHSVFHSSLHNFSRFSSLSASLHRVLISLSCCLLLVFWQRRRRNESYSFSEVNGKYCKYCWMRNELEMRTTNDIRLNRWRRFVYASVCV